MAYIGTSNPINLCQGLPLLPTGAARAGIAQGGHTKSLFTKGLKILFWKFNATAGYDIFIGMCGPSTAFLVDSDLSFPQPGQFQVKVHEDQMEGGFIVGFNFGAYLDITTETFHVKHWYSPWKGKWKKSWSGSLKFTFDLINLIVFLIEKVLDGEEGAKSFLEKLNAVDSGFNSALTSTWGMFDERTDQLISQQGKLTAKPSFTLPINIVPLTAEIPGLDVFYAFDETLQAVGGWFSLGPTLSLEIPVTLNFDSFKVDSSQGSAEYTIQQYDSQTNEVISTGAVVDSPNLVGANVSYDAGFTIGAGAFISLGAFKVFSVNLNSPSIDLLKLFGVPEPTTATMHATTYTDYPDGVIFDPVLLTVELPQENPLNSGELYSGTISISEAQSSDTVVLLTSDVTAAGIPDKVTIEASRTSANFKFTPQNQCPPEGSVIAGSTYSVNVTAQPQDSNSDIFPDTASMIVTNQILTATNDSNQGTTEVHLSQCQQNVCMRSIDIVLPFPAPAGGFTPQVSVVDDSLQSVASSIAEASGTSIPEGATQASPASVTFYQGGTDFANTYYVIVDGGCEYGQVRVRYDVYQT